MGKERCEYTVDSWGCTMERLLINAVKRNGIQLYDGTAEVGGEGNACTDAQDMQATIYLLLSVSNHM